MKLIELPNIGRKLERTLKDVGIDSVDKLLKSGSCAAFSKIRLKTESGCINMLYALEGAIQGCRWHELSSAHRADLKEFFDSFTKQDTV